MQILERKASDLLPYPNNAKTHSTEQVAKVAASINEFGFNNPILVDEKNSVIAGHCRLEAAQKLGLEKVPTITLSHLSEAQRKAYILADNRLAEVGTDWDLDLVSIELEELIDLDFDIDLTGWDDSVIISGAEADFPELNDGAKEPFQQITFTLHDSQVDAVKEALQAAKDQGDFYSENENSNGNALHRICENYAG